MEITSNEDKSLPRFGCSSSKNQKENIKEKNEKYENNPFAISCPIVVEPQNQEEDAELNIPDHIIKNYKEKLAQKLKDKMANGRERKDSVFATEQDLIKNPVHQNSMKKKESVEIEDKRPSFMSNITTPELNNFKKKQEANSALKSNKNLRENKKSCCLTNSNSSKNCTCSIF